MPKSFSVSTSERCCKCLPLGSRYAAAGRYVNAAGELQIPLNHLTTVLNPINGRPYKIWRIGTRLGAKDDIWPMMKEERCVAIGWLSTAATVRLG